MAPKKRAEDNADKPPEGDDERFVTMTVSGEFDDGVASTIRSPILVVWIPGEEPVRHDLPTEQSTFSVVVHSKKVHISTRYVEEVIGGQIRASILSLPEVKDLPTAPAAPAKGTKAGRDAPAKKGPREGASNEFPLEDMPVLVRVWWDLCGVLTKCREEFDALERFGPISALKSLRVAISSSEPLLAPVNIQRFQPVVIEVVSAHNVPGDAPLDLEHTMQPQSPQLSRPREDVYIKYTFANETVMTEPFPHKQVIFFHHRRAFFLYRLSRLEFLEKYFYDTLDFELHDRDAKAIAHHAARSGCYGVGRLNMRLAVTESLVRVTETCQVVPHREEGFVGDCADYLSNSTALKVSINFLSPFPRPAFVQEAESKAKENFLTRAFVFMPYRSTITTNALQAILGTLVHAPKGGPESAVREIDRIVNDKPEATVVSPPAGGKKGGGKENTAVQELLPPLPPPFRLQLGDGVSGFEIMDDSQRIICFEGPIMSVHGIIEVATAVIGDDPECRVLINGQLKISQR